MKLIKSNFAGVIAGTPVDTRLGVNFLHSLNYKTHGFAISPSSMEQDLLQKNSVPELQSLCLSEMKKMESLGVSFIVIYCSSLSSALDINDFRQKLSVPVYTPLDHYLDIANKYNRFSVIAANEIGLAGFESIVIDQNKKAIISGMFCIDIVRKIEADINPKVIVNDSDFIGFIRNSESKGCECLVLACTHFEYIRSEVESLTDMRVIDIDSGLSKIIV